jgi:hypothetical protein
MHIAVHAGFHKTGTTSFQDLIRANLDRAPAGCRFEVVGKPLSSHLQKVLQAYHPSPSENGLLAVRKAFAAIVRAAVQSGSHTLFISLETICGRMQQSYERGFYDSARSVLEVIRDCASGHRLTFMFSTRNPEEWVKSAYAHMTRHHNLRKSFAEFSKVDAFKAIDWSRFVNKLTEGLNADVIVSDLDESKRDRLGPHAKFLSLVLGDASIASWHPVPSSNASLPPAIVSLMQSFPMRRIPVSARRHIIRKLHSIFKRI